MRYWKAVGLFFILGGIHTQFGYIVTGSKDALMITFVNFIGCILFTWDYKK